jgi:hypothetical protein
MTIDEALESIAAHGYRTDKESILAAEVRRLREQVARAGEQNLRVLKAERDSLNRLKRYRDRERLVQLLLTGLEDSCCECVDSPNGPCAVCECASDLRDYDMDDLPEVKSA